MELGPGSPKLQNLKRKIIKRAKPNNKFWICDASTLINLKHTMVRCRKAVSYTTTWHEELEDATCGHKDVDFMEKSKPVTMKHAHKFEQEYQTLVFRIRSPQLDATNSYRLQQKDIQWETIPGRGTVESHEDPHWQDLENAEKHLLGHPEWQNISLDTKDKLLVADTYIYICKMTTTK